MQQCRQQTNQTKHGPHTQNNAPSASRACKSCSTGTLIKTVVVYILYSLHHRLGKEVAAAAATWSDAEMPTFHPVVSHAVACLGGRLYITVSRNGAPCPLSAGLLIVNVSQQHLSTGKSVVWHVHQWGCCCCCCCCGCCSDLERCLPLLTVVVVYWRSEHEGPD